MRDDDGMTEQERRDERLGALAIATCEVIWFACKVVAFLTTAVVFYHFIGRWW